MLADFVVSNREQIITRCRSKVAMRASPPPSEAEIDRGVPMFLDELLRSLRLNLSANADMAETATALKVSEATLLRDWRAAKAWLAHELRNPR